MPDNADLRRRHPPSYAFFATPSKWLAEVPRTLGKISLARYAALLSPIFWLALCWNFGLGRLLLAQEPPSFMLSKVLSVWHEVPWEDHWFLPYREMADFRNGHFYGNYSLFFFLPLAGVVSFFSWLLQCSYAQAESKLLVVYLALPLSAYAFAIHRARCFGASTNPFRTTAFIFLGWGIVISCPTFILSLIQFHPENFHLIVTVLFAWLSVLYFVDETLGQGAYWLLFATALLAPLYFPVFLFCFLSEINASAPLERVEVRRHYRWLGWATFLASFSYWLPKGLGYLKGFQDVSSGFLFRSGLDGDSSYVTSLWQVISAPSSLSQRHWNFSFVSLLFVFELLAIYCFLATKQQRLRYYRQLAVMLVPYLFVIVCFPQFSSIHVYFVDNHFYFGITFLLAFWTLTEDFLDKLRGIWLVLWAALMGTALMTNLLALASHLR